MSDEIKDNILSPSQWLRIVFMALYGLICWVLGIVITALILGQALFSLITGRDNTHLRHAGNITTIYFYQILRFLTYCSDEKPFPFAPLPTEDDEPDTDEVDLIAAVDEFDKDDSEEEEVQFAEEASQDSSPSDESEVSEDIVVSPVEDIEFLEDEEPSENGEPSVAEESATSEESPEDNVLSTYTEETAVKYDISPDTEATTEDEEPEDDVFADISFNSPDDDEKKPENP